MVGPTKLKPSALSAFEILRETSFSVGTSLRDFALVWIGPSVDEIPQEARESAALLDDEPGARAGNRRLDLGAVAHDAGVEHQRLDLRLVEAGDHRRIEAREGLTEVLALAQDGDPGQPRLEAVENEFFEQRPVVEFRHAPFRVVVRDIEGIGAGPPAAGLMVGMEDQSVGHGTV